MLHGDIGLFISPVAIPIFLVSSVVCLCVVFAISVRFE
jgi:hypothetical protein